MANSEITFVDGRNGTVITAASLNALKNSYFNVKNFGATGDGTTSDTTNITAALTAATASKGVVFLPPGTYVASVTIPNGVTLIGSGRATTWIKGVLTIGSNVVIRDLKFGNTGVRGDFGANADDVLIENCWLFGGNGESMIYMNNNKITNVRFVGCEISGNTSGGNGVQIVDKGTVAKHFENITFTRCWFHSNDRMNFECIQRDDGGSFPVVSGYRNISLYDCVLDSAAAGVDSINVSYDGGILADSSVRSSGYSTVRGCRITGGLACLELAGATDMLVEGNDMFTTDGSILSMSAYGAATTERHIARFVGNKFAGTGDVTLYGEGVAFIGNDVKTSASLRLIACAHSIVSGNVIETSGTTAISIEHSKNNVFTSNQVRGGSGQSFLFIYTETTNNLVDGNYLDSLNVQFDIRDGTTQYFGKNMLLFAGVYYITERSIDINNITYSTSVTPEPSRLIQKITVTNGTGFTINSLAQGGIMTFDIYNNSGGAMGTITWVSAYKLAGAFTNPANGKHRTISFYSDGTNWIETNRATADI